MTTSPTVTVLVYQLRLSGRQTLNFVTAPGNIFTSASVSFVGTEVEYTAEYRNQFDPNASMVASRSIRILVRVKCYATAASRNTHTPSLSLNDPVVRFVRPEQMLKLSKPLESDAGARSRDLCSK
ncbi:hypothetical protein SPRG_20721, partial [Saprolegnia parasitica CBS 223.65]